MSGIIMLSLQLGVAIGSFVGMTSLVGWYNKGGKKNDSGSSKTRIH